MKRRISNRQESLKDIEENKDAKKEADDVKSETGRICCKGV